MTMSISIHHPHPAPTGMRAHPIVLTTQVIVRLTSAFVSELRRRRAVRELAQLDDHMLADIGLRRGEIELAARLGRSGLLNHPPLGLWR